MARILSDIFPNGFSLSDIPQPPPLLAPDAQLRVAMADAGLTAPDEVIFDGKIHRFSTSGKRKDDSGWYVAYDGKVPAGAFGDWRQGVEVTWRADIGRDLSHIEQMQHVTRMRELKAQRERELAVMREEAADNASMQWESAPLASDEHPYLQRKGITNPGLRVAPDGRLMAPMYIGADLVSLQMIDAEGSKRFLKGGKTGGAWWCIGSIDSKAQRVYVGEGVATAQSIFEATGKPVAVAYSAGNMAATAQAVRAIVGPMCEIVIVADNDDSGTGQREGEKAAQAVGGRLMVSPVGDANDYAQQGGDLAAWLEPVYADDALIERMKVVMANELPDDYEPPDEIVQGLLTANSMSVIYGDSNSGKTFFTIDMACAIALGIEWMGRKTEQGLVVFLATESPNSVRTRLQAYQRHHGVTIEHFAIVQAPVNFFTDAADCLATIKIIKALEAKHGVACRMVIGDTLARISAGANENSGEDMGPVMARFDRVREETGAHVNVIHHNGKDQAKGARGWSGIRAHIDTEIELAEINGKRIATVTKQRELPGKMSEIAFDLKVIALGTTKWGDDATSCVVVQDESDSHGLDVIEEPKKLIEARKFFEDAVMARGRRINGVPFVSMDSWNDWTRELTWASDDSRRQKIARTKKTLLESGYISEAKGGYEVTDHPAWIGSFIGLGA